MTTKVCTRCHVDKPLAAFSKHSGRRSGLDSRCRDCKAQQFRDYRAANRDREVQRSREFREENPGAWRGRDPVKKRTRDAKRRERIKANPARIEHRRKLWRGYYARNREQELARARANYLARKQKTGRAHPAFSIGRFPPQYGAAPVVLPDEVIVRARITRVELRA